MSTSLELGELKKLFLEYQKEESSIIFQQIKELIEPVLVNNAYKLTVNPNEYEECYSDCLIGLREAILTFDKTKPAVVIPTWVFFKCRYENEKVKRKIKPTEYEPIEQDTDILLFSEELMDSFITILSELIEEKIITLEEVELIRYHFLEGKKITDIIKTFGNKWGKYYTVRRKCKNLLTLIKREVRNRRTSK